MPVYRSGPFIEEAIASVLSQTFSDFELVIVCDEATDELKEILDRYSRKDSRIRVHHNQERLGLVASRNLCTHLARGVFINSMDSDDISHPERFERQVAFLKATPEVGVLGTDLQIIGGRFPRSIHIPSDDATIRCALFSGCIMAASTVMIRREVLETVEGPYRPEFEYAEDFDLWVRCADITKFANLAEPLLWYRVHGASATSQQRQKQEYIAGIIRKIQLNRLKINPSEQEFSLHQKIVHGARLDDHRELDEVEEWLSRIEDANNSLQYFPRKEFQKQLGTLWYSACRSSTHLGGIWSRFHRSKLSNEVNLTLKQKTWMILGGGLRIKKMSFL